MKNTYTLIKRDGTRLEVPFLLQNGERYISPHISEEEANRQKCDDLVVFEPITTIFEAVRSIVGGPIVVNRLYTPRWRQEELYREDLRKNGGRPSGKVAHPDRAPHLTGAAMDIEIPDGTTARQLANLIRKVSVDLGFPMARVGWKAYGGTHVHFDEVSMLFEPYIPGRKNPVPGLWVPGGQW